jgi:LmbE family N-acetylglucosaminyl deacetylase
VSALFLSPHNDDETLFGSFSIQATRAHVIVVLRSDYEQTRWPAATAAVRELETAAACAELGVSFEQWAFSDLEPDWPAILARLQQLALEPWTHVFAPAVEPDGHPHHNSVGVRAAEAFGDSLLRYTTYSRENGRHAANPVRAEPEWIIRKLRALSCYRSQIELELMRPHFLRPLDEYLLP